MKQKTSIQILLGFICAAILFHISVIARLVPYDIAWGGRLQNDTEMYVFESISILILLFWGLVLLMKGAYVKYQFKDKMVNTILWFFLALFLLNTVGNIFAKTNFEKFFSLLTLVFAILIWTILKANKVQDGTSSDG